MKKHELKIIPQYFQAVWDGIKTFELRKDDRDYQHGDVLVLKEWDGEKYTGSAICVKVTYILRCAEKFGLKDGFVIMGISRIESNDDFKPKNNYDKLHKMSAEQMALWMAEHRGCDCCPCDGNLPRCAASEVYCMCEWFDWLMLEVKDAKTL